MILISKINIINFKAISKFNFEPSRINIFVGRNNTGKSTILEALALVCSSSTFEDILGENILKQILKRSKCQLLRFGSNIGKVEVVLNDNHVKSLEIVESNEITEIN